MDIWKPEIGLILFFGGPLGVRMGPENRPRTRVIPIFSGKSKKWFGISAIPDVSPESQKRSKIVTF